MYIHVVYKISVPKIQQCIYQVCQKRNETGVTKTLFQFGIKFRCFSSSLIHFSILFFHASMDPRKDSSEITFNFMVTALLISMCDVKLVNKRNTVELMDMLGLKKAAAKLARANAARWYGHGLK